MATADANGKSWIANHLTALTLLLGLVLAVIPDIARYFEHDLSHSLQALIAYLDKFGGFTLIERFGDALFIAASLWFIAEHTKENAKIQAIFKDVLLNTAAAVLPEDLKERLRGYLDIALVRTWWKIEYRIDLWDPTRDHLRLQTISEYEMHNYSVQPKEYEFIYEVEESQCGDANHEVQISQVVAGNVTYRDEMLKAMIEHDADEKYFKLKLSAPGTPATFAPFRTKLNPQATQRFSTKSTECFKRDVASPFWSKYSVLRTTFDLVFDENAFVTFFDATAGQETVKKSQLKDENGMVVGERWETLRPILPGQGFFVRVVLKNQGNVASSGSTYVPPPQTDISSPSGG